MAIHEREVTGKYEIKPRIPDHALTLTKIENTVITCRVCRGAKLCVVRHISGRIQYHPCPCCKGSGLMDPKLIWSRE